MTAGSVSKVRYQFRVERSNEYRIKQTILRHYDHTTRPVRNDKTPVNVLVAISLYHILDTVFFCICFTFLQRCKLIVVVVIVVVVVVVVISVSFFSYLQSISIV